MLFRLICLGPGELLFFSYFQLLKSDSSSTAGHCNLESNRRHEDKIFILNEFSRMFLSGESDGSLKISNFRSVLAWFSRFACALCEQN